MRMTIVLLGLGLALQPGCSGADGGSSASTTDESSGAEQTRPEGEEGAVAPSPTTQCQGVSMPRTVEVEGHELTLNGMGLREARIFQVDVYVAGLYLEQPSTDAEEVIESEQVKHLVLHMVRGITRQDAVNAWDEGFRANTGPERIAIEDQIAELSDAMTDVLEGEEMVFTYIPEVGLEVRVRDILRTTIEGEEFAQAFLRVWLGPSPPNEGLRRGLLGGPCG